MDIYPSNSNRSKAEALEEKKVEKVTNGGNATLRKKTSVEKIRGFFDPEDIRGVKDYIIQDVIKPDLRDLFWNIVTGGLHQFLYKNGAKAPNEPRNGSTISYVSYDRFAEKKETPVTNTASRMNVDDIVFATQADAEAACDQLRALVKRYGIVTVGDYFDMADLTAPYTANRYGWTNLDKISISRLRSGGYIINLPKAMPID